MLRSRWITAKNGLRHFSEFFAKTLKDVGSTIHRCFEQCGEDRCRASKRFILPHLFSNGIECWERGKSNGDEYALSQNEASWGKVGVRCVALRHCGNAEVYHLLLNRRAAR